MFFKAAKLGNADPKHSIGVMCDTGEDVVNVKIRHFNYTQRLLFLVTPKHEKILVL